MNQYEMVAIIVLIAVAGGVLKSIFDARAARSDDRARQPGTDASKQREAAEQRIIKLEQRIEVLEHIVTSDGYDLKQRFKELNGTNLNDIRQERN